MGVTKNFPLITTKRLIIERIHTTDANFLLALFNSDTWKKYIGDRHVNSKKAAVTYIKENFLSSYRKYGYGLYKISLKNSNTPIGICGFVKRVYLDHPDLGFAILPEFEGQGYVSEATAAVLSYGKSALALEIILAITIPSNTKSQDLLTKLEFIEIDRIFRDTEELILLSKTL